MVFIFFPQVVVKIVTDIFDICIPQCNAFSYLTFLSYLELSKINHYNMSSLSHQSFLQRLCRVCGQLLTKKSFSFESMKGKLEKIFVEMDLSVSKQNIPNSICMKCYSTCNNLLKRKDSSTSLKPMLLSPHDGNCLACNLYVSQTKAFSGKIKKKSPGRPTHYFSGLKWTKTNTIQLFEKTDPLSLSEDQIKIFPLINKELNPQYNLCLCKLCNELTKKPVRLGVCEDNFCLTCFVKFVENTSNYSCPKCEVAFGFTDIFPSITIPQLINTLRFECENRCGEYFELGGAKNYQNHKQSCRGPKPPPCHSLMF